tara:strand:+ start:73 stop:705 length:633 start_codon:yes stop_codon:yes gene_type:complete
MIPKQIKEKGIISKLLEQSIRILLFKECKKIKNLKIDIVSSSKQIIKGEIQKLNIIAESINYKDLLFDEFELEANHLKIHFNLLNKEFLFKNNPIIKFKISLSQNSLRTVLLCNSWNWIGNMISKEIFNQEKFEDIVINNGQLIIKISERNINMNQEEQVNIKSYKGKLYLVNKNHNKIFQIPIEDKVYIEDVNIENNLINIFANSSLSL